MIGYIWTLTCRYLLILSLEMSLILKKHNLNQGLTSLWSVLYRNDTREAEAELRV